VTVERGTLRRGGRAIGKGHRINASHVERSAPGILLLDKDARPPIGELAERYLFAGDPTGAPASVGFDYESTGGGELSLGAKAYGVDLSVKASVELTSSMNLTYELTSGVNYELHRLEEGEGLVWAKPRRPRRSKAT
jgi:hypothetical protein